MLKSLQMDSDHKLKLLPTKHVVTSTESETSTPNSDVNNLFEITLPKFSEFRHIEAYLHFCCDECHYRTKSGHEFEKHLRIHEPTPEFDGTTEIGEECMSPTKEIDDNSKVDLNDDEEDFFDDFACVPHRGYLCDLCQFNSFDLTEFQNHLDHEELQIGFVQQSISSPICDKTCVKCGQVSATTTSLFEHVTKYHSRPTDFPDFGDMEWKYLMTDDGSKKRTCSYCGAQFTKKCDFINHLKSNMGEEGDSKNVNERSEITVGLDDLSQNSDLQCTECKPEQSFNSQDALRIHNSTFHHRSKKFKCAFCNFDGLTVKDLNSHINMEHEGNFNKCLECDFETWAHSVLRRHINVKHRKIKSHGCQHCSYTAMSKSTLLVHVSREHSSIEETSDFKSASAANSGNIQFACCFCKYKTTSKNEFKSHFDISHNGNRTQCLECDFKAPVISHLRRHIDSVHRGLKKFPCDLCDHRATTKQGLERHVRVRHLNLKDLQCPHCEYKTSAPDALRAHAKKYHEIEDPEALLTEDCKDVVKKESKKRIYFGNRIPIPMVCRLCGEGAPTTNKLAAHFAECHSFEKPFWCHECNIGYETYYGIQNHNRKDHSEERHLCPICGYSTHGPQYLKRHYRRKHPHQFEAWNTSQQKTGDIFGVTSEDKISSDEKMKVALELKGLSDEEISERVKALIELSADGIWTCRKCERKFEGKPKRALYSHIRERHFHMRHFKCKECNFLSYNRAEIQEHKEKHKADKPIHQCDLCKYLKFTQKRCLNYFSVLIWVRFRKPLQNF